MTFYKNDAILEKAEAKGQIISKANYGILNSYKKRMNKVVFTTLQSLTGKLQGRITSQGDPCSHYRE